MEVTMGQLRDQMVMEMQLRNYSNKTIEDYTQHIVWYTKYFGRSPAELGETEIKQYLHHLLVEREVSWSYVNVAYSALQFLYEKTLNRSWNITKIPRPKIGRKLPVILSEQELVRLFNATSNFKHRMILMVTPAAGLRVSETAKLQLTILIVIGCRFEWNRAKVVKIATRCCRRRCCQSYAVIIVSIVPRPTFLRETSRGYRNCRRRRTD